MKLHKNRKENGLGLGSIGSCSCLSCGYKAPHQRGVPCTSLTCSECGASLSRAVTVEKRVEDKVKTTRQAIKVAQVNKDLCVGCGACISYCPFDAISLLNGKAVIDEDTCRGCMKCARACPKGAISRA